MGAYRLTRKAETDLAGIYEYSVANFGLVQAQIYLSDLYRTLELIAGQPRIGRDYSRIRSRFRRHDHASHSIYYLPAKSGVVIVRVLGASQDPARHL